MRQRLSAGLNTSTSSRGCRPSKPPGTTMTSPSTSTPWESRGVGIGTPSDHLFVAGSKIFTQAEFGNAVLQHSSRHVEGFEDGDLYAVAGQGPGACQA